MGYWGFESLEYRKPKYQNVTISAPEPAHEAIDLETVKNYLKVDHSVDDDLIELIIKSIRKQIENDLGGFFLIKRTVTQKQTGGVERIDFLRQPVNSVTSVTYYENFDSTASIVSSSDYRFSDGELYHRNNWFDAGRESDGYVIVYNAGLIDDTNQAHQTIPANIKQAMLRLIAYTYENREEYATTISEGGMSIGYNSIIGNSELKSLLSSYMTSRAVF
jgi:uncharacterized phiE125 gp8 family phage protein